MIDIITYNKLIQHIRRGVYWDEIKEKPANFVYEIIWQDIAIEPANGINKIFTFNNVWKEGKIVVLVDGIEVLNGIQVDTASRRNESKIVFVEAPPEGSIITSTYEKE